ncbi:MAG TPA: FHA domain-containing protein [Polyangiaceae bacterium]|nr:FHA domain-containing protein [Polyangiaceae bacterium]
MALTVVVRSFDGKTAPRITLDAPRIVIGRGDGCEVRLPDPSVSHRHASIRQRGAEYIVLDEGSTNGTFVGPVRLASQAPRVLRSGDLVRVGRVWLEIVIEQIPPTPNATLATCEMALALVAEALAADGAPAVPRVQIAEGPGAGAEFSLDTLGRTYVVGRLKSADLSIDDPDLSRRHVELVRRGDKLVVIDLGSKNGTTLGEKKLDSGAEIPWPRGESLKLGATRLVYDDPVGDALEQLEKAADERIRDNEPIDPPTGAAAVGVQARTAETDTGTGTSSRRDAPVSLRPARAARGNSGGWTAADVFVAFLAVVVLGMSIAGLVWLIRS